MLVTQTSLTALFDGFNAAFTKGKGSAEPAWPQVAMTVPSAARTENYGWLGQFPRMREWIGDRVIQNLSVHEYALKNQKFESTVSVSREDIEDDRYGVFAPIVTEMGRAAAEHPDELVFSLLSSGFSTVCYDGKPFFAADHPVTDEQGKPHPVSNLGAGEGAAWFLLDTSRAIRPMIFQERYPHDFTALTDPGDPNVFWKDDYVYGVRGRSAVGFGLWQLAYGSRATLNAVSYGDARAGMMDMRGDRGRKLGIRPNLLVVPPSLEGAARKLLTNELGAGGETNEWKGTAELLVTSWLV